METCESHGHPTSSLYKDYSVYKKGFTLYQPSMDLPLVKSFIFLHTQCQRHLSQLATVVILKVILKSSMPSFTNMCPSSAFISNAGDLFPSKKNMCPSICKFSSILWAQIQVVFLQDNQCILYFESNQTGMWGPSIIQRITIFSLNNCFIYR